jgi:GT2 family glycosyltransferase
MISAEADESLLELPENSGYFKGLNAGIEASGQGYDFLVIGNNDLEFDQSFITELKKCSFDANVQVIAPDVVTLDGRHQNPLALVKASKWEKARCDLYFFNYYLTQVLRIPSSIYKWLKLRLGVRPTRVPTQSMPIRRGIGACYAMTPTFFARNRRLDDRVFLWGEEALLSNQVYSSGGVIMYCPALKVTHFESASVRFVESRARFEIVKASYKIYREYL